jgi:hypothetical protein
MAPHSAEWRRINTEGVRRKRCIERGEVIPRWALRRLAAMNLPSNKKIITEALNGILGTQANGAQPQALSAQKPLAASVAASRKSSRGKKRNHAKAIRIKVAGDTGSVHRKAERDSKRRDIVGRQFGHWHVMELAGSDRSGKAKYRCRCICGTEREVKRRSLLGRKSRSCGCAKLQARKFFEWRGKQKTIPQIYSEVRPVVPLNVFRYRIESAGWTIARAARVELRQ